MSGSDTTTRPAPLPEDPSTLGIHEIREVRWHYNGMGLSTFTTPRVFIKTHTLISVATNVCLRVLRAARYGGQYRVVYPIEDFCFELCGAPGPTGEQWRIAVSQPLLAEFLTFGYSTEFVRWDAPAEWNGTPEPTQFIYAPF